MNKINSALILKKLNVPKESIQWYIDNMDKFNNHFDNVEEYGEYVISTGDVFPEKITYSCFKKYIQEEQEYFNFLNCPNVEEGLYSCSRCKSKRIYKFSKQTRAGDESTTVFAICTSCKKKWTL
jgi:hypothetical protein